MSLEAVPFSIMRYTRQAFPLYRYRPGENPHPTEHVQGHSYEKAEKPILNSSPENWVANEAYLFGVDLYNHFYWWEAHEAWEGIWKTVPRRSLMSHHLQGLIKISAAFLKWHEHNRAGVETLYAGGIEHLAQVLESETSFMGLNLMDHIAKLSNHFRVVVADDQQWPEALTDFPFIILQKPFLC